MSTESSVHDKEMWEKEYRHGLVSAQFEIDLPLQIRAIRKQRNWTQPELAALADMKQPRISAIEKPGGANFTLETLRRLAKAFDVALIVRFAPFGELSDWSKQFNPDNFHIPSFEDDPAFKETATVEHLSRNLFDQFLARHPENATAFRVAAESIKAVQRVIADDRAYSKFGAELRDFTNIMSGTILNSTSNTLPTASQVQPKVLESANTGVIKTPIQQSNVYSITSGEGFRRRHTRRRQESRSRSSMKRA